MGGNNDTNFSVTEETITDEPIKTYSTAMDDIAPVINHTYSKIFLQTPAAQGIAGAFAFAAMILTGHHVSTCI